MPTFLERLFAVFYHRSLQSKLMMALLITAMTPVFVISVFSYHKATSSYQTSANLLDQEHLKGAKTIIDNALRQVPRDLRFLTRFQDLERYLLWRSIGEETEAQRWLHGVENGFRSFMQTKPLYMQLRVIDNNGWEVMRLNRMANQTIEVSAQQDLQRKDQANYYKETMKLEGRQLYVSPLNLNREHGEIQKPHVPVIRYALPMIDQNGMRQGMIILNVLAAEFLEAVEAYAESDNQQQDAFYIVNQQGFYLLHPNKNKVFGFDLGLNDNLAQESAELWQVLQGKDKGTLETAAFNYTFEKVLPEMHDGQHYWYIIHKVSTEELFGELVAFERLFFALILCIFLLLVLAARPLIRRLVQPIQQVTSNLKCLERGETSITTIDYAAEDEIREMVGAATGLSQRMTEAIAQANTIAQGDFRTDVTPRSDQDELGIALQDMTRTLQNVTELAEAVARGDLESDLMIKGDNDRLGTAVNTMIATMRDTVVQAKSIAEGDFRAEITPRSDKDSIAIALKQMVETLRDVADVASSLAHGAYNKTVQVKGEYDQLGRSIVDMTTTLKNNAEKTADQDWLKTSLALVAEKLQNKKNIQDLASEMMLMLPKMLRAEQGAFYVMQAEPSYGTLQLEGSYAFSERKNISNRFGLGEGLVGQCALEKQVILLTQVPDNYITIQSGLGESKPQQIIVLPLLAEGKVVGVMELAKLAKFTALEKEFLDKLKSHVGLAIFSVMSTERTVTLLAASQKMTDALQTQQEALQEANTSLATRADELKTSEVHMKKQQLALQKSNHTLQEKNTEIEQQKEVLEEARHSLELQSKELSEASQYKSDFLSNMSHELRTPLNSLLILADMLAKNKDANLTEKQVEFAHTIHSSGVDLLELINDILDLAKIESGKMLLDPQRLPMSDVVAAMQRSFVHVAEENDVVFRIEVDELVPNQIFNDGLRMKQVLKNLLSNAFKFTAEGEVVLSIKRHEKGNLSFAVRDTGTGIAKEKLQAIFEAFQQEDGSTSRKYGGTGLGLSISRELSKLLGGYITVESVLGHGSCFTLYIPAEVVTLHKESVLGESKAIVVDDDTAVIQQLKLVPSIANPSHVGEIALPVVGKLPNRLKDDRQQLKAEQLKILIIEDDPKFAKVLQDMVRDHGFQVLNALQGDHGLAMAQQYKPDAILLDLQLPVMSGMKLLKRLKQLPETRHIPVHVISCMDEEAESSVLRKGAISFLRKPVNNKQIEHVMGDIRSFLARDVHKLLIVEDNKTERETLAYLLAGENVEVTAVRTGKSALGKLHTDLFDCMVLDLSLPDMSGETLLDQVLDLGAVMNQGQPLPVVIHTGKDLKADEMQRLQQKSKSVIVKGVDSSDRLLVETSQFLHQVEKFLPEDKQWKIEKERENNAQLDGRCVLLVDDDIRNIYSLSAMLEALGMKIITARDGKQALAQLEAHADDVDLVLMDIMMPEMDGHEAMNKIRQMKQHEALPIIALTAKAMKGDREHCIASGASDYVSKPIDIDKLTSLMGIWLDS